jgi:hypothetical protein
MKSICLVAAFFGQAPAYLPLFMGSVARNPDVDFLLVTDMAGGFGSPANLRVMKTTLADLSLRIAEKTGVSVSITQAYKLCDFKPAYGMIFETELAGYDYWGWCDLDLVFGRIRLFFTEELLARHAVLTSKPYYISGAFTLVRNERGHCELFKQSPDWQRVFSDQETNYSLDECAGCWNALAAGQSILEVKSPICSFTEVVVRAASTGKLTWYHESLALESVPGTVLIQDGRVLADGREYPLMHFVVLKASPFFGWRKCDAAWAEYSVSRWGVHLPGEPMGWRCITHPAMACRVACALTRNLWRKFLKGARLVRRLQFDVIFRHVFRRGAAVQPPGSLCSK